QFAGLGLQPVPERGADLVDGQLGRLRDQVFRRGYHLRHATAPSFAKPASSASEKPQLANGFDRACSRPRGWAGVREKRGAGAGWTTPSTSTKPVRATACGWRAASSGVSTGVTQASVPAK